MTDTAPEYDPVKGIYAEGEDLPPARQLGPTPPDPTARPDNKDRHGRPIPSWDARYQWPQYPTSERRRVEPTTPGPTDGYVTGEEPETPEEPEPEPPEEAAQAPAMPAQP